MVLVWVSLVVNHVVAQRERMLFARLAVVANPEKGIAHLKYKRSRNINPGI